MVQQSPIDEQIREYILQQERIDEARRQLARIGEPVRRERRKWERQLGYFILAGVAVHNKPGQMVLIVLGSGVLAFPAAFLGGIGGMSKPSSEAFSSHFVPYGCGWQKGRPGTTKEE
jgi:hypothetical protein